MQARMLVAPPATHITPTMDPFSYLDIQDAAAVDDDDYLTSLAGLILPPQPPAAVAAAVETQGSAFVAYQQQRQARTTLPEPASATSRPRQCGSSGGGGGGANVHGRMFGYLRRIGGDNAAVPVAADAHTERAARRPPPGGAPCSSAFRHITRERLRRERLSQGFADLHALLPPGASRGGKNDIVAVAAVYIRELVAAKERLRARNDELLGHAVAAAAAASSSRGGGCGMVVKVRAESERHSAAVDVLEVVLRRLKAMEELRVTAVRSCFGAAGMWMDVGVECKIPSCGMEKAITNALMELEENKTVQQDPGSSKPIFRCQVESGVLIP